MIIIFYLYVIFPSFDVKGNLHTVRDNLHTVRGNLHTVRHNLYTVRGNLHTIGDGRRRCGAP